MSVSEISHNQSEKYMPVSSSVGFFTSFRMTENKKKYVILSVSEISHDQSVRYMYCQFFGGILHYVQNDV